MSWDLDEDNEDVDSADVVERAKSSLTLRMALEMRRPPNWWGTAIPPDALIRMAHAEGIPVSWVPQADILTQLVAAATPEDRLAVLDHRFDDILKNCASVTAECTDEWLTDERTLVERAISATQAGHHEAGMALAVSVGEPLAIWASTPRVKAFMSEAEHQTWDQQRASTSKYLWANRELGTLPAAIHRRDVLRNALIAPVVGFFKPFHVEKGDPVPTGLSRHVVAHRPTHAHFGKRNCLLALMLATSILREMESWSQEVRMMDAPGP